MPVDHRLENQLLIFFELLLEIEELLADFVQQQKNLLIEQVELQFENRQTFLPAFPGFEHRVFRLQKFQGPSQDLPHSSVSM